MVYEYASKVQATTLTYFFSNQLVFMYTFGVIFIVTTFMILFFINEESMKSIDENSQEKQEETNLNLFKTYKMMWKMLNLARVRELAFILLTSRVSIQNSIRIIKVDILKNSSNYKYFR